jgi:SRSO17 transposase
VGELRSSGEPKYYLSNLPARITRQALVGAIKARWLYEQLKEELGLDHFESRSWTVPHRHALMTCLAFAYLQHRCLAGTNLAGWGEMRGRLPGPLPLPSLPAFRQAIDARLFEDRLPSVHCPCC